MFKFVCMAMLFSPALRVWAKDNAIPQDAVKLINAIHKAAVAADFNVLRRSMMDEFVWSFGDNGNADQAVNAWRGDRTYLRNLAHITGLRCERKGDVVECPKNAGMGYRVGFKKTEQGRKITYSSR